VTSSVYVGHSAQDLVDSQNIQRPLGVDQNVIPIRQIVGMKPLLKWAGGKRHIASSLETHLPSNWAKGRFYEPFMGGAAMFFHLEPKKSSLCDVNAVLITF